MYLTKFRDLIRSASELDFLPSILWGFLNIGTINNLMATHKHIFTRCDVQ